MKMAKIVIWSSQSQEGRLNLNVVVIYNVYVEVMGSLSNDNGDG